jgi:hypothetical protein
MHRVSPANDGWDLITSFCATPASRLMPHGNEGIATEHDAPALALLSITPTQGTDALLVSTASLGEGQPPT